MTPQPPQQQNIDVHKSHTQLDSPKRRVTLEREATIGTPRVHWGHLHEGGTVRPQRMPDEGARRPYGHRWTDREMASTRTEQGGRASRWVLICVCAQARRRARRLVRSHAIMRAHKHARKQGQVNGAIAGNNRQAQQCSCTQVDKVACLHAGK